MHIVKGEQMPDIPDIDLLEYAKRHLITHMLESGMSVSVIEQYIDKMPYTNPLRTHFASQLIAKLNPEDAEAVRTRLLRDIVPPTVGLSVHTQKRTYTFPITSYLDEQTVDDFVKRVFESEKLTSGRTSKDN